MLAGVFQAAAFSPYYDSNQCSAPSSVGVDSCELELDHEEILRTYWRKKGTGRRNASG